MSDLEKRVDSLVTEFEDWFQELGNEPLVRSERAAIKTFCWFLSHQKHKTAIPELQGPADGGTDVEKAGS